MKEDIHIKNGITIPAHELKITTSRAGGPGGQHVNKADTRITIHWNIAQSSALTDHQKQLIMLNLKSEITLEGAIVVHNAESRSQLHNKKSAMATLARKIKKALHVPKKRMKTKVPKKAQEKRLQTKKRRGEIKKMRQKKVSE